MDCTILLAAAAHRSLPATTRWTFHSLAGRLLPRPGRAAASTTLLCNEPDLLNRTYSNGGKSLTRVTRFTRTCSLHEDVFLPGH
eukprot:3731835-Amphidinium_carterae.4